jgi:ankyrin repeat protein
MLWVKGKPGAGKSTLMKFALSRAKAGRITGKTLEFFFHGRGTALQKSSLGLLRALAHQIGMINGRYILHLANIFRDRKNSFESWSWKAQELADFLAVNGFAAVLKDMPVRVYIDALDECGEEEARRLVQMLSMIQQRSATSRHGLSICFSCRHYPIIAPDTCMEVCMEYENGDDISLYIRRELERSIENPTELELLRTTIEKRSQHVFQWVVLVVPRVVWLFHEGDSLKSLLEHIDKIPQELHSLYDSILQELSRRQPAQSLKLFQWVCFGFKALSVPELRGAMNVDATLALSGSSFDEWTTIDNYVDDDNRMRKQLRSLSGGLVEIGQFGVQLIHQSVQDFLLEGGLGILEPSKPWIQEIAVGEGHNRLARSCMVYFLAVRKGCLTQIHLFSIGDVAQLSLKHPLLVYSLNFWAEHMSEAEKRHISQADMLDFLPGRSSHCLDAWQLMADCLRLQSRDSSITVPHQNTFLLHEAAKRDVYSLIPACLSCTSINARDGLGRTALSVAAEHAGIDMVRLLLSQQGIDVNLKDRTGRTALSFAMERDHLTITKEIMNQSSFDISVNLDCEYTIGSRKQNTMQHAVRLGCVDIVRLFLSHPQLEAVDGRSLVNMALMNVSVFSEVRSCLDIIELLLQSNKCTTRVDLNSAIPLGREQQQTLSPLLYFAYDTNAIFEFLASRSEVDVNFQDAMGRSLLHISITTTRPRGWRPGRIRRLLKLDSLNINARDHNGDSALVYALTSEDTTMDSFVNEPAERQRRAVVELLLTRPDLDINLRSGSNQHPLSIAVERGHYSVAEVLLADPRLVITPWERRQVQTSLKGRLYKAPVWRDPTLLQEG